jgi:hypothetical protein
MSSSARVSGFNGFRLVLLATRHCEVHLDAA